MSDYMKGYIVAIFATLLIGIDAIVIRYANLDGVSMAFYRNFFVFVVLFGYGLMHYKVKALVNFLKEMPLQEKVGSLLLGASGVFFSLAIPITSVANVMIIFAASPCVSIVVGRIITKERTPPFLIAVCVMTLVGVFIAYKDTFTGFSAGIDLGIIFAILFMLCNASMFIVSKSFTSGTPRIVHICIGTFFWSLIMLLFRPSLPVTVESGIWAFINGGVLMSVFFISIIYASKRIPSAEANLIFSCESVLAVFFAWILLNEIPNTDTVVGGMIVFCAVILNGVFSIAQSHLKKRKLQRKSH